MKSNEELAEIIEKTGIKATANRILVYKDILGREDTFSLNDMEDDLTSLDKSTIFRTLTLFCAHHLIHGMEDGSGQVKYCHCSHPGSCEEEEEHCHFYCTECKKSYCLEESPIKEIKLPEGFKMTGINYVIIGICAACAAKKVL